MSTPRRSTQVLLTFTLAIVGLLLASVWWLTRGDWIYPEQPISTSIVIVTDTQTVGQSFFARQAGLEAIEVRPVDPAIDPATLRLDLRTHGAVAQPLFDDIAPSSASVDGWVRFTFDPIQGSRQQSFQFTLKTDTSSAPVSLQSGPAETYYDGALYLNAAPQPAQLTFRTVYSRPWLAWDFVLATLQLSLTGIAILLIYVIPGWALVRWLSIGTQSHWVERLGLAAALGAAIYPLLILWTYVAGWQWGAAYVWGPLLLGLVAMLYTWRSPGASIRRARTDFGEWLASDRLWVDLALIAVLAVVGIGRLWMVRDLALPMWDDSVQHLIIVNRLIEADGLFQSWQPYAPYQTFSLHFGFHANVAAWIWASGMDSAQAVLLTAQVLNFVAVLALAPLAYRIGGVWAALIAILAAGLFTQFPAYYMNWGRYPQMTGQAILPAAAWWLWMALTRTSWPGRRTAYFVLAGAVTAAGMTLGYYRMAFHFAAFALAALLVLAGGRAKTWRFWLTPIAFALLTGLLFAPWLLNFGTRPEVATVMVGSRAAAPTFWEGVQQTQILWMGPNALVIFLGTLVIAWLGAPAALPVIWLWVLVLLPMLRTLPLPGVEIIQELTIDSSLYIPIALIWGIALGGIKRTPILAWRGVAFVAAGIVVIVALIRLPLLLAIVDPDYDLSARPDFVAAAWARDNLPPDAVILINGLVYSDGVSAVGSDAGWWLPVLSGQRVTIPPQYALIIEQPEAPGYSEAVNSLVSTLFAVSPTSPAGKAAICAFPQPVTHVFLGQRQGMVDKPLPNQALHPMLPAAQLIADPAFRLIYQHDLSMIFEFDRTVCAPAG